MAVNRVLVTSRSKPRSSPRPGARLRAAPAASAPQSTLPASVQAAWGRRTPSGRGPRPGLTLDRIVEAGVRVASAEGIGAVSMGRVAHELGAATMALYRHVSAKDELLALMVDAAFREPPPPPAAGWRASLAAWAAAHLAVLRRHPWLVRVPIGGPPLLPNQVRWFEAGLAGLARTPLREAEKVSVLLLVNGFVRNEATLGADLQVAADARGVSLPDAAAIYGRLLGELVDPAGFPALSAVLAAGVFDGPGDDGDDGFAFGLDRILDGVAVLVRRPARRGGAR
jgi:AcrR family transcriptional regulator